MTVPVSIDRILNLRPPNEADPTLSSRPPPTKPACGPVGPEMHIYCGNNIFARKPPLVGLARFSAAGMTGAGYHRRRPKRTFTISRVREYPKPDPSLLVTDPAQLGAPGP